MIRFTLLIALLCTIFGCAHNGDSGKSHHDISKSNFDVIIVNGTVYIDGYASAINADVGVRGGRIQKIGDLKNSTTNNLIDATGKLVVPGFIDTHSHADKGGALDEYLLQGVTTIVAGNCGRSLDVTDLDSAYKELEGNLGPNYVGLIGHNSLRSAVDLSESNPSPDQMARMKAMISDGMNAGAFGMSTGLIYNSGFNSKTQELVEIANVVANHEGLYATHMRNEGPEVLKSVVEALKVGHKSGARVQISHVKCAGPKAWGLPSEFLRLIDEANENGLEVWADQYPYSASQTTINAVIPDWAENDWENSVANRRDELEEGIRELIAGRGGADRIYMVRGPYAKRVLGDVSKELNEVPEIVIIDRIGLGGASAIYHMMQEEDVQTFMAHPRVMIGSDGPSSTHPRGHGSFPRVWGNYGREVGLLSHQECVLKTSTLASTQLRLNEQSRGKIAEGYFADITILDPNEIIDRATFDEPTNYPTGISEVLVNGRVVVRDGEYTGELPGKVLHSNKL